MRYKLCNILLAHIQSAIDHADRELIVANFLEKERIPENDLKAEQEIIFLAQEVLDAKQQGDA
jgi:hypothetical protein